MLVPNPNDRQLLRSVFRPDLREMREDLLARDTWAQRKANKRKGLQVGEKETRKTLSSQRRFPSKNASSLFLLSPRRRWEETPELCTHTKLPRTQPATPSPSHLPRPSLLWCRPREATEVWKGGRRGRGLFRGGVTSSRAESKGGGRGRTSLRACRRTASDELEGGRGGGGVG